MELLVMAMLGYGLCAAAAHARRRYRDRQAMTERRERAASDAKRQADLRRSQAYAARQRLRRLNHLMQTALLQLEQAPDFRRAASFATLARDVPLGFRQQQFCRFRPKLLGYLVTRLRGGGEARALRQSLDQLARALGMAAFEADYLWQEAHLQIESGRPVAPANFASSVATLEQEHQHRVEILRTRSQLDEELREQLIEAEEQRFREAMLRAGDRSFPQPAAAQTPETRT